MKKKLMMVAVLLGALTLGACVDDNESQSVTNVREAKAKQLTALADLSKAQAEAELIKANAQKAYQEAQAEYYKAQAAVENADAADKEFLLKKAKEEYERNLEAINLEAQNRLLAARIQAARNEQEFLELANDLLKDLYRRYASEVSTLDIYKSQLNSQNLLVTRYEAGAISTDQANAAQKAIYENNILGYKTQIEAYKAYTGKDKAELAAEANKLYTEYRNLYMDYTQAGQIAVTARVAYDESLKPFNPYSDKVTLKTLLAQRTLTDLNFYNFKYEEFVISKEANLSVTRYSLNGEASIVYKRQDLKRIEATVKTELGAPKAGDEAATGLYASLENAETQLADAMAAENPDQGTIDMWTGQVASWKDQINSKKAELAEATQNCTDFEAAIASFAGDDMKAYDAALEALKSDKAVVAYIEAMKAEEVAQEATTIAQNKWQAAQNLSNAGVDAKQQILYLESNIADNQKWIAELSNDYTQSLQQAKDEVTRLTTQIELQEAVVALAKKNLDAAIAAQE